MRSTWLTRKPAPLWAAAVLSAACSGSTPTEPTASTNGRTLPFSGYQWQVKTGGDLRVGPGPNYFSEDSASAYVDLSGALHVKIRRQGSTWQCAEVILNRSLGYGTYTFVLEGGFERLDRNIVLGLFTWDSSAPEVSNREIDIEFSRWGQEENQNSQFVVQPFYEPGRLFRFAFPATQESTHSFTWTRDAVVFESRAPGAGGAVWRYAGAKVPTPGNERVHINLWLFGGVPPSDGAESEAVVRSFRFVAGAP
jgi:hypothetical protein